MANIQKLTDTDKKYGDTFVDKDTNKIYAALRTERDVDNLAQYCFYYYGTVTVTGGGGDVTVTLPFDWTNGVLFTFVSTSATEYFRVSNGARIISHTTYQSLTSSAYTGGHVWDGLHGTGYGNYATIKSNNAYGFPKSATTTSFTLDDSGTTAYIKYCIFA